jgi:alcohol dehydrogenase class IV
MWYFYSPTLVFGEGALDHLEDIEGKKCFIVTDPGIKELGMLDILTRKLGSAGKEWQAFTDVEPDPTEETTYKAAKQCKAFNPDLIIGIGGGSSMDVAKGVWVLYEHPEFQTVDEIHPFQKLNTGRKARLIAIPTTSGTGAEATWAVIITREKEGQHIKLEQGNKAVVPTYAIIDPVFPQKMPPTLTTATGFDALAHSLEGFISTWQNTFSDALAIHATRLVFEYLPRAVRNADDLEAREQMHNAATMAGLAFGNSQVIMGHAMAHAIGAVLNVPHGNAVGLCLPFAMEYCIRDPESDMSRRKFSMMAKSVGVANWTDHDATAAGELVNTVTCLQKETGLPTSLKALGIVRADLDTHMDTLVEQCLESASTVMTPRSIGANEFRKIFDYMYEGESIDF